MAPRKSSTKSSPAKKTPLAVQDVSDAASPLPKQRKGTRAVKVAAASPSQLPIEHVADDISSESEVEILEIKSQMSKKRTRSSSSPEPGSPAYERLPPVSVSSKSIRPGSMKTRRLSFGSFDGSDKPLSVASPDSLSSINISSGRRAPSGRNKIKTEKQQLADESLPTAPNRSSRHKKVAAQDAQPSSPSTATRASMNEDKNLSPVKVKKEKVKQVVSFVQDENEVEASDVSSGISVTPPAKLHRRDSVVDSARADPESDSDIERSVFSATGDGDDEGIPIINRDLQDPGLYDIYDNLPHLPLFCDVVPYNPSDGCKSPCIEMKTLRKVLGPNSLRLVKEGLRFVQSGFYVNTARIDPSRLVVEGNRMKIAATKQLAVGIMLGLLTELALHREAYAGPTNAQFPVHRGTVAPFPQEMCRDSSAWGQLFDFRTITGTVSDLGISFSSRRKAETTDGSFFSPASSSLLTTVSKSTLSSPSKGRSTFYGFSRAFEDRIPIYDGRISSGPGFSFTDDGFNSLSSLPLYRDGNKDLKPDAVVAVGYTLGTWTGRNGDKNLSTNLQFLILLGATAAKAAKAAKVV